MEKLDVCSLETDLIQHTDNSSYFCAIKDLELGGKMVIYLLKFQDLLETRWIQIKSNINYKIINNKKVVTLPTSENDSLKKTCLKMRGYLVIVNIFECVADHADAHVDQVRGSHLKNLFWELLSVLVDLLQEEDVVFFTVVWRLEWSTGTLVR